HGKARQHALLETDFRDLPFHRLSLRSSRELTLSCILARGRNSPMSAALLRVSVCSASVALSMFWTSRMWRVWRIGVGTLQAELVIAVTAC
ncbi:MAG: hypothetical protein MUE61_21540, partial [Vicinamibacterales bacterium]|nr:hypothetical protein [Vicinamibacterales bacterium]